MICLVVSWLSACKTETQMNDEMKMSDCAKVCINRRPHFPTTTTTPTTHHPPHPQFGFKSDCSIILLNVTDFLCYAAKLGWDLFLYYLISLMVLVLNVIVSCSKGFPSLFDYQILLSTGSVPIRAHTVCLLLWCGDVFSPKHVSSLWRAAEFSTLSF